MSLIYTVSCGLGGACVIASIVRDINFAVHGNRVPYKDRSMFLLAAGISTLISGFAIDLAVQALSRPVPAPQVIASTAQIPG